MAERSKAETAELLARLLRTSSAELDRAISAHLGEDSIARWHVLAALGSGEGIPMSALAEVTPLHGASFTRFIEAMVADNLVHRKVDPLDRRRVLIYRTRRGTSVFKRMEKSLETDELAWLPADAAAITGALTDFLAQLDGAQLDGAQLDGAQLDAEPTNPANSASKRG